MRMGRLRAGGGWNRRARRVFGCCLWRARGALPPWTERATLLSSPSCIRTLSDGSGAARAWDFEGPSADGASPRERAGRQGQPQRVKVIGRVGSIPRAPFTGDPLRPAFLFPAENPEPLCS
jgi:hypothetical protein